MRVKDQGSISRTFLEQFALVQIILQVVLLEVMFFRHLEYFLETFGSSVQNWCRATYLYNLETFSFLALSQHWSERWERWGPRRENGGFWWRQNKNRQRLAVITGGWVKDGGAVQETDEQPGSLYSFVFYFLYLYLNSHLCFFCIWSQTLCLLIYAAFVAMVW